VLAPLDAGGLVPYMLVAREGKHSLWEYKSQGVQWFSDELRIRLGTLIMLVLETMFWCILPACQEGSRTH
jgi:hypothetical protein